MAPANVELAKHFKENHREFLRLSKKVNKFTNILRLQVQRAMLSFPDNPNKGLRNRVVTQDFGVQYAENTHDRVFCRVQKEENSPRTLFYQEILRVNPDNKLYQEIRDLAINELVACLEGDKFEEIDYWHAIGDPENDPSLLLINDDLYARIDITVQPGDNLYNFINTIDHKGL